MVHSYVDGDCVISLIDIEKEGQMIPKGTVGTVVGSVYDDPTVFWVRFFTSAEDIEVFDSEITLC